MVVKKIIWTDWLNYLIFNVIVVKRITYQLMHKEHTLVIKYKHYIKFSIWIKIKILIKIVYNIILIVNKIINVLNVLKEEF